MLARDRPMPQRATPQRGRLDRPPALLGVSEGASVWVLVAAMPDGAASD